MALWGVWFLLTGLSAVTLHQHQTMLPARTRAMVATVIVGEGWLVGMGWLSLGRFHALIFSLATVLGVAWLAGLTAQSWILAQGAGIAGIAILTWRVRHRDLGELQGLQLAGERLEEMRQQCTHELTQLGQALDGVHRRLERYRALQEVAYSLSRSVELPVVARRIVTQADQMIGKSTACLLLLLNRSTQSLALTASHRAPQVPPSLAKRGDALDYAVLRSRRSLIVDDVLHDARFAPEEFHHRGVRAVVATPLMIDQRVEGILRLESRDVAAYTQEDLRLLDLLAELSAMAIATARLYAQTQELAMTDGLTGLLVRRALLEGMRKELLRAERRGETRSLLMVDIDHFKRYNDALGHAAGDLVLKGVARVLKAHAGSDGLVARYGGEEFTVLLHLGDPTRAVERSERIRQAVADEPFILRREPTHVTISIGVAHYPADGREPLELLRVADERMYRAKQSGRNRVCSS